MSFPFDYNDQYLDDNADDILTQQPIITADEDDLGEVISIAASSGIISSRKKARVSTPSQDTFPSATEIWAQLDSDDADTAIGALNNLLKLSADHDINYALGEGGERVVQSLVDIFDETVGWTRGNDEFFDFDVEDSLDEVLTKVWSKQSFIFPSNVADLQRSSSWVDFIAIKLAPSSLNTSFAQTHIPAAASLTTPNDEESAQRIKILEVIIMIIRNLTYVSANVRFLVHNLGVLRIVAGAMYFRNFSTGKTDRGPKSERDDDIGTGNSSNNMCLHAVQTILNLSSILDCTARNIFCDKMFLNPDTSSVPTARSSGRVSNTASDATDVKSIIGHGGISHLNSHVFYRYGIAETLGFGGLVMAKRFDQRSEAFSKEYDYIINPIIRPHQNAIFAIYLPIMTDLLGLTTSRAVVLWTMETIIQLLDSYGNHLVAFKATPDLCLYHLVRLLYISRLGPDSFEYVDPVRNMVTRVGALKLLGSYDTSVDCELRDRSVEVLVKIASLSECPDIKIRLGQRMTAVTRVPVFTEFGKSSPMYYGTKTVVTRNPKLPNTRLYDALMPCLTTKVGREQTPQLAAKLLTVLFSHRDNRLGMEYTKSCLLLSAMSTSGGTSDATQQSLSVADVLCKGVLNQIQ